MSDLLPRFEDLLPLWPGLILSVLLFLVAWWSSRKLKLKVLEKVALLSIPVAVLVTWWNIYGELPWPPRQSSERALWLTLVAPVIGIITPNKIYVQSRYAIIIGFVASIAMIYFLLRPLIETSSAYQIGRSTVLYLGLFVLLWHLSLSGLNRSKGHALLLVAWGATVSALAQIMVIYGVASLAQIVGSFGLLLLTLAPVAFVIDLQSLTARIIYPVVAAISLFCIDAFYFGDVNPPLWIFAVVFFSPALVLLEPILLKRRVPRYLRQGLILLSILILLSWAVKSAFDHKPMEEENPYSDYEGWDK